MAEGIGDVGWGRITAGVAVAQVPDLLYVIRLVLDPIVRRRIGRTAA
jgi:hypothetical protein